MMPAYGMCDYNTEVGKRCNLIRTLYHTVKYNEHAKDIVDKGDGKIRARGRERREERERNRRRERRRARGRGRKRERERERERERDTKSLKANT
jgi:hypothetical protein